MKKVYLIIGTCRDDPFPCGVFSSLEEAKAARAAERRDQEDAETWHPILEVEMGKFYQHGLHHEVPDINGELHGDE